MPKRSDDEIELQRSIQTVKRLYGRLWCKPGRLWLLTSEPDDPQLASRGITQDAPPPNQAIAVEPVLLARVHHAIKELSAQRPSLRKLPARVTGGVIDAAWLHAAQQRLDLVRAWLLSPPIHLGDAARAWHGHGPTPVVDMPPARFFIASLTSLPIGPADEDEDGAIQAFVREQDWLSTTATPTVAATNLRGLSFEEASALCRSIPAKAKQLEQWWPWLCRGLEVDLVYPHAAGWVIGNSWSLPAVRAYLLLGKALSAEQRAGLHEAATYGEQARLMATIETMGAPTQVAVRAALLPLALRKESLSAADYAYVDTTLRFGGRESLVPEPLIDPNGGSHRHPEVVSWLGGSAEVDRLLSLQLALGEPVQLSKRLLADVGATTPALINKTRRRIVRAADEAAVRYRLMQVDRCLQRELSRALGFAITTWSEAWRDAARLFFAETKNSAALRTLLVAVQRGTASSLRTSEPANAKWLQHAGQHFDVDAWMNPPTVAVIVGEQTCHWHAERDPLQALRMGVPFHTCLSIDDGCNRFAAVANALDANKWVFYLRNARGNIVARKLVAVSRTHELLGYQLYSSLPRTEDVGGPLDEALRGWAQRCRLPLGRSGEPLCLVGEAWYDDGVVPWVETTGSDDAVAWYCRELGMPVPNAADAVEEDFAEEAQTMHRGAKADLESLPSGYPLPHLSFIRARIVSRHGVEAVHQADKQRRHFRALMAHAIQQGLRPYLAALIHHDGHADSIALDALFSVGQRSDVVWWLQQIKRSTHGAKLLGDHGAAHDTLASILEALQRLAPEDAFALAHVVVDAWKRLQPLLPNCSHCFEGAHHRLVSLLVEHWRREHRDPQLRITLRANLLRHLRQKQSASSTQVWLRVLAAQALETHATLEQHINGAATTTDREVLKVLNDLPQRGQVDSNDPWLFAARLRHTAMADVDVDALTWPTLSPLTAMGDLLRFHPQLWQPLRRYAPSTDDDVVDDWTLWWLREVRTGWHTALPDRVLRLDKASTRAAELMRATMPMVERQPLVRELQRQLGYHHDAQRVRHVMGALRSQHVPSPSSPMPAKQMATTILHELNSDRELPWMEGALTAAIKDCLGSGDALWWWRLRQALAKLPALAALCSSMPSTTSPYACATAMLPAIAAEEQQAFLMFWMDRDPEEAMDDADHILCERIAVLAADRPPSQWAQVFAGCYDAYGRAAMLRHMSAATASLFEAAHIEAAVEDSPVARLWLLHRLEQLRQR